jgi:hypothetical protein
MGLDHVADEGRCGYVLRGPLARDGMESERELCLGHGVPSKARDPSFSAAKILRLVGK